jgi:hypothetical protein
MSVQVVAPSADIRARASLLGDSIELTDRDIASQLGGRLDPAAPPVIAQWEQYRIRARTWIASLDDVFGGMGATTGQLDALEAELEVWQKRAEGLGVRLSSPFHRAEEPAATAATTFGLGAGVALLAVAGVATAAWFAMRKGGKR